MVDYYGTATPLSQVANVNTPDARTLSIQPWEKTLLSEIEKAILHANIGFNPMNNGESIIINVPPLTEERRKDLVKLAKTEAENAKVGIRNARKDGNTEIKKSDASEDLQKQTLKAPKHQTLNLQAQKIQTLILQACHIQRLSQQSPKLNRLNIQSLAYISGLT